MVEIGQKFGRRLRRLQISEQIKEQRTTFNMKISISLGVRKLRQGVDVKVLHICMLFLPLGLMKQVESSRSADSVTGTPPLLG